MSSTHSSARLDLTFQVLKAKVPKHLHELFPEKHLLLGAAGAANRTAAGNSGRETFTSIPAFQLCFAAANRTWRDKYPATSEGLLQYEAALIAEFTYVNSNDVQHLVELDRDVRISALQDHTLLARGHWLHSLVQLRLTLVRPTPVPARPVMQRRPAVARSGGTSLPEEIVAAGKAKGVCLDWNMDGRCARAPCKFKHLCVTCAGEHPWRMHSATTPPATASAQLSLTK